VTTGRPDYILGQFRETARCRDAQHGDGVCCALASQLVLDELQKKLEQNLPPHLKSVVALPCDVQLHSFSFILVRMMYTSLDVNIKVQENV